MNKEQTKQIKSLLNKYEVRGTIMRSDESLIEFTNKLMEIAGVEKKLEHLDILETIEAISRATWSEKTSNVIEDKLIKYLEML